MECSHISVLLYVHFNQHIYEKNIQIFKIPYYWCVCLKDLMRGKNISGYFSFYIDNI